MQNKVDDIPLKLTYRLINGGLNAEAATIIHKELTEHIVRVARNFKFERERNHPTRKCKIIVYYNFSKLEGEHNNSTIFLENEIVQNTSEEEKMENWLGKDLIFMKQVEGDLSVKISYVANQLFSSSSASTNGATDRVIFLGIFR